MQAFLVCGIVIIVFFTTNALSLKCQACGPDGDPCSGPNVKGIECEAFADRCMTVTMTMNVQNVRSQAIVMKNCSHSTIVCQEDGVGYPCKSDQLPSGATCSVDCCKGDMCNQASSGIQMSIVVVPTATATVLAASKMPTNASMPSNTTTTAPGGIELPSAGVAEFTAASGAIFLGVMVACLAASG